MRALQILGTVFCFELLVFSEKISSVSSIIKAFRQIQQIVNQGKLKWNCWPALGTIRRFWPDTCRRTSRVCSPRRIIHPESPLGAASLRFRGVSEDLATSELPKDTNSELINTSNSNSYCNIARVYVHPFWIKSSTFLSYGLINMLYTETSSKYLGPWVPRSLIGAQKCYIFHHFFPWGLYISLTFAERVKPRPPKVQTVLLSLTWKHLSK